MRDGFSTFGKIISSYHVSDPSDGSGDSEKIEQVPSNQGLGSSLGTLGTLGHLKEKKRKVSAIGKVSFVPIFPK